MTVETARVRLVGILSSLPNSALETVKSVPVAMWFMPLILSFAIWAFARTPLGWMTEKPVQEIAAPVVIGITAALMIAVHQWVGAKFSLLLACFVWSLFLRELHFWGTNNGFYIAFVVLVIWGWLSRHQMEEFLNQTSIRYFLSGALLIYLFSKIVDRGYLSFLPDFKMWRHNLEER